MLDYCMLINSRRGIDSEYYIARIRGDLCALVGAIQDARNDAIMIADHHIARFKDLLLATQ